MSKIIGLIVFLCGSVMFIMSLIKPEIQPTNASIYQVTTLAIFIILWKDND